MKFQPVLVRQMEETDDIDRIFLENLRPRDVDAVIFRNEIAVCGKLALASREGEENAVEARHMLGLLFLQRGTDDAGEVAHILRHEKVMLHEAFDIVLAGMRRIAKALRNLLLYVEVEPLF